MRTINLNQDGLSAMELLVQQLDKIIDFASSKFNISKDLKTQGPLLRLRRSMDEAKQDHVRLVNTAAAAEPGEVKDTKSTQAEPFAFAGSPKGVVDAAARDKHSQKRVRQPAGGELSGGARKAKRILTPKFDSNAGKSDPSQAFRIEGKDGPEKTGPSRKDGN